MGALFKRKRRLYRVLGAKDEGRARILYRFAEWNTCGRIVSWEILRFLRGAEEAVAVWQFGGVSLVRFDADAPIRFLQEFGCNANRYDPYANGHVPVFRYEKVRWFCVSYNKKTGLHPGFAASYRCSVCCCTWRLIASKLSALMTCSIRHASSAAVDASTPSAASQSDKKVCRS